MPTAAALAPAPAAAWQRVQTVAELCAEAGGRPIVRAIIVRGQGRAGPGEPAADLQRCTITVARGAVLRLADVAVSGYPELRLRLRSGAVVLVGNGVRAPDYVTERVAFDLPLGASCYAIDNESEVACPAPGP